MAAAPTVVPTARLVMPHDPENTAMKTMVTTAPTDAEKAGTLKPLSELSTPVARPARPANTTPGMRMRKRDTAKSMVEGSKPGPNRGTTQGANSISAAVRPASTRATVLVMLTVSFQASSRRPVTIRCVNTGMKVAVSAPPTVSDRR